MAEVKNLKLFCLIIGSEGVPFHVDITNDETVSDLKKAIWNQEYKSAPWGASKLTLYMAKKNGKEDGDFIANPSKEQTKLLNSNIGKNTKSMYLKEELKMNEGWELNEYFKGDLAKKSIHILVKLPDNLKRKTEDDGTTRRKLEDLNTYLRYETSKDYSEVIIGDWDIDAWTEEECSTLKDLTAIHDIFPFVPKHYFVRLDEIFLIQYFKEIYGNDLTTSQQLQSDKLFVVSGSPGVGKSCLMAILYYWLARKYNFTLLFAAKIIGDGKGIYLLKKDFYYKWNYENNLLRFKNIFDLLKKSNERHWIALDGFRNKEMDKLELHENFTSLSTSNQIHFHNEFNPYLRRFLLPFWTKEQIAEYARLIGMTVNQLKERYYYSGGNLRDFLLSSIDAIKLAADTAVLNVEDSKHRDRLSNLRDGLTSDSQIDRIRMPYVKNGSDYKSYTTASNWVGVITSKYVMQRLSKIIKLDYYGKLMRLAREMNNPTLEGIAFENQFHAFMEQQKRIKMHLSDYWQSNTVISRELLCDTSNQSGYTQEECFVDLAAWAASPDDQDYWYPFTPYFKAIDSILKYVTDDGTVEFWLIQLTKSSTHNFSQNAVSKLANIFMNKNFTVRYLVVVPTQAIMEEFCFTDTVSRSLPVYKAYFDLVR